MLDLINQSQSIQTAYDKKLEKDKSESLRRLSASVDVTRFLLRLGLSFRGHNESQYSSNRGIFLELLQWYGDINEVVGSIILENAPKNEMMCSPSIQKDIVDYCAKETIKAIIEDLDGNYFGILVHESKDTSHKEQMAIVLRYVSKEGEVVERFVGIIHVSDTSARSLKEAIYSFLSDHSLSPSQIRGQGYDGASNMQGELNGLKTLILNETPSKILHSLFCSPIAVNTCSSCKEEFEYNLIVLFPSIIHVLEFTGRECPNYTDRLVAKSLDGSLDIKYSHRLRVDIFYAVIDLHLQELKNRFDAVSSDLLLGMSSLNPVNSFGNFDKNRIMRLAECYMNEFDSSKLRDLSCQLDSFIVYVRGSDKRFFNLKGISDLAKLLVMSDLHQTWPLVYLLIKLTLILPVATASVERAFSSMKYIKNELRNSIGDEFLIIV
ncbi:uncharacterized protein LOC132063048 [Lycium ferocissimum]|uniref:uncharacterized protein LOC132063048 n=1 Tax=Lycium ferocissimum TaxID=112874 RepID=UPI002814D348|nr:uncharacterized protein LOC132063048 [Lycium ferocissimum]